MALITCKECGKEISDKADFCPHCGYKNNSKVDDVYDWPYGNATNQTANRPQDKPQDYNQYDNRNQSYYNDYKNGVSDNGVKAKAFSILGFVLSLVSLLLALWGIVAVVGLIFSIIGLVLNGGQKTKSKNLAVSGIILCAISLAYTLVQFLAVV